MKKTTWRSAGASARRLIVPTPEWTVRDNSSEYSFPVFLEMSSGHTLFLQRISFVIDRPMAAPPEMGAGALMSVLLPAMTIGVPVTIEGSISPLCFDNLTELQEIFATWMDDLQQVDMDVAVAEPPPRAAASRTGSWFSLGVDGWHTQRRHGSAIDELLFAHGFDIDLERHDHRNLMHEEISRVARELGVPLLTLQSNLRTFTDAYLWWGMMGGAFLGAAAQVIAGEFDRTFISSSNLFDHFGVFGSNALTDPLFSTRSGKVLFEGGELSRLQKIEELSKDEYVLKNLRVCWEMNGTTENCGRCPKCLRTLTALELLGVRDKVSTFPKDIDFDLIRRVTVGQGEKVFFRAHREYALLHGLTDSPVMRAWEEAAQRSRAVADLQVEAIANGSIVAAMTKDERSELIRELTEHAPEEMAEALASYVPRQARETFGQLWKTHRRELLKAIFSRKK